MRLATPARVAWFGLAGLLVLIGVSAIGITMATNQASDAVTGSTALSNAYEAARFAVASEESLERKYRLEPSPEVLQRHKAAGDDLVAALKDASAIGTSDDVRLVTELLDLHRAYLASTVRMFAAVDRGDAGLVLSIDTNEVDPVFAAVETRVAEAAAEHGARAADALASLTQTVGFTQTASLSSS